MLRILIYSENLSVAQFVRKVINNLILKLKCNSQVETYYYYKKITENIMENPFCYDIYLLDGNSEKTYDIAKEIRRNNLLASIVFFINANTQLIDLLKYRPTGVVLNPTQAKDVFNGVKMAFLEQQVQKNAGFLVKTREHVFKLDYNRIDYFENTQRVVTVYFNACKEKVSFYATLEKVYESLPKNIFMKCHQSLIVNVGSIKSIDRTNKFIILNCGKKLEISKRHYSEVINFFEAYYLIKS